jgi:hypothetical protein
MLGWASKKILNKPVPKGIKIKSSLKNNMRVGDLAQDFELKTYTEDIVRLSSIWENKRLSKVLSLKTRRIRKKPS